MQSDLEAEKRADLQPEQILGVHDEEAVAAEDERASHSWVYRVWTTSWCQIIQVALAAFCMPGMYNAMTGTGGGGNVDPYIAAQSSVALTAMGAGSYLIICVPVFEIVGVRTMGIGGWTYALYAGSLLHYADTGNGAFVLAAGTLLGLGSAFFWLVQGAIMISYPLPHQKGRAISLFWIIFNSGGAIGAFIAFAQTYGKDVQGTLAPSTYWAFVAIMIVGAVIALCLAPPWLVVRSDGSRAGHNPKLSHRDEPFLQKFIRIVKREFFSVLAIRHEKRLFFLIPMFAAANWFYSYQQNIMNGLSFDLDGRTLNSALYWLAQMFGGFIMGWVCDLPWFTRPRRALIGWTLLFVYSNAVMGGGLAFENLREANPPAFIKMHSGQYAGGAMLYFFYGMLDSLWQGYVYWLLGAMCSTPELAGKLVAVFKVAQSIGAAVAYQLTADDVSERAQFISNWVVAAATLLIALPAVLKITEPTEEEARGGMTEGEKSKLVHEDFRKVGVELGETK